MSTFPANALRYTDYNGQSVMGNSVPVIKLNNALKLHNQLSTRQESTMSILTIHFM